MTFKNIFTLIIILLFCGLFFSLIRKGLRNQNINLEIEQRFIGKVKDVGETFHISSKFKSKVFFLKLYGLDQKLEVYRRTMDYTSLTNQISIGDTVTVYYKGNRPANINIDLFQIEKRNKILLDKSEFEAQESNLIWIGAIGVFLTIGLAIGHYFKNMRTKQQ